VLYYYIHNTNPLNSNTFHTAHELDWDRPLDLAVSDRYLSKTSCIRTAILSVQVIIERYLRSSLRSHLSDTKRRMRYSRLRGSDRSIEYGVEQLHAKTMISDTHAAVLIPLQLWIEYRPLMIIGLQLKVPLICVSISRLVTLRYTGYIYRWKKPSSSLIADIAIIISTGLHPPGRPACMVSRAPLDGGAIGTYIGGGGGGPRPETRTQPRPQAGMHAGPRTARKQIPGDHITRPTFSDCVAVGVKRATTRSKSYLSDGHPSNDGGQTVYNNS